MPTAEQLLKNSKVYRDHRVCSFCQSPFAPGETVVFCPRCEAIHHTDCWSENADACAVLNCSGSGPIRPGSRSASLPTTVRALALSDGASTASWVGRLLVFLLFVGVGGTLVLGWKLGQLDLRSIFAYHQWLGTLTTGRQVTLANPEPQVVPAGDRASPPATATSVFVSETATIGKSVQGRDLTVTTIGYEGGTAVVLVGSIQGRQTETRELVDAVIIHFERNPERVPGDVVFHLIPLISPDGNANDSRYNARGVDLNRNWDTSNWKPKAAAPGYPDGKEGAGGPRPFSEPETRALRDFLLQVESRSSRLRVVTLHSSVRRSKGEVYPGGDRALGIARTYANTARYDIQQAWDEYVTSGEAVTWCDEQGIAAIDIVLPASQNPYSKVFGSQTLLDVTVQALVDIAEYR